MVYTYRKRNPAIETGQQWWDRTKSWKSVYHETGHVWFATRSGWPVKLVTLDPKVHGNPNANGLTELYSFPAPIPEMQLSYIMAGKVCERLVLPNWLWRPSMMGGYDWDVEKARDYLKQDCGVTSFRQQDKLLREAEAQVRALVTQPAFRDEIDRLAEALMESQTLSGTQVRAILGLDQGSPTEVLPMARTGILIAERTQLPEQTEFENALNTMANWDRCPYCGTPRFVVPGFFEFCSKCGVEEANQGV